jgi:hypothetical protein
MRDDVWWIVRLRVRDKRGHDYFSYLTCKNSYQVKYSRTPTGRKTPRKWGTHEWKTFATAFSSLGEARRSSTCTLLQKKLKRGYDMVEILRCEGDHDGGKFTMEVVERPGVGPLTQLAMEAE